MKQNSQSQLAEKIAKLLESEQQGDLAAIFAGIERINYRLDKLEQERTPAAPQAVGHASQERFSIAEAIVDELFAAKGQEKACTFEPNDRPCDHCSMCSSRGF